MTTVMVTVCDSCEKRIATGAVVTDVYVKTYKLNEGNSSSNGARAEVCAECVENKTFKLDVKKGLVPA